MSLKTKEQVQREALPIALKYKKCGLAISMGVGKTYLGLQYIKNFYDESPIKVLVVAPKISILNSWKEEAKKFGLEELINCMDFTTYLSLDKQSLDYDIIILDECHSLLFSHGEYLQEYKGRILGLTGTKPRFHTSEKGLMVKAHCPIMYEYLVGDAISDKILNDYLIEVHEIDLSYANDVQVKLKHMTFYTSEIKNYNYWSEKVAEAMSPKQKQISSVMRMKAMQGFKSKERYAERLLAASPGKTILFCNTQEQADRLCAYSYHSKNPDSEENLTMFKKGEITKLSCVLQLNEGVNIPGLKYGIIMHSYGNERKLSQRIGRLLRLNPDDVATVYILCHKNTIDEKWVKDALKDFDETKIKYIYES